jgi:hypothetical protein
MNEKIKRMLISLATVVMAFVFAMILLFLDGITITTPLLKTIILYLIAMWFLIYIC